MSNQLQNQITADIFVAEKDETGKQLRKTYSKSKAILHVVPGTNTKALLNKISVEYNYESAVAKVVNESALSQKPFIVSYINAHAFNLCHTQPRFASALINADLLFRDGKGMEIFLKSAAVAPGINMCGTDTIPMIIQLLKNKSIALVGTREPYLSAAAANLMAEGYNVILTQHGFLSSENYISSIKQAKPQIIIVGMGMPAQELVSDTLKNELGYPCIIINGGAIIDHWAQRMSRAPKWMRKYGFEWLYRLLQEPRRLFNRYVIGNILFLVRVYKAAGRIKL